jgi:predicted TIM-barrel fold metal-dependent hydrolase
LSFDLCVLPRQMETAIGLARACPEVQFVLDHCGVPDVKGAALDPWRAGIRAIAALPNVAAKLSGIVAYADPESWTVADLRPFAEHVIESFGWERMMWGSDHPVCTRSASLGRWMDATHVLLAGASETEKAGLLGLNARRIYRLG